MYKFILSLLCYVPTYITHVGTLKHLRVKMLLVHTTNNSQKAFVLISFYKTSEIIFSLAFL